MFQGMDTTYPIPKTTTSSNNPLKLQVAIMKMLNNRSQIHTWDKPRLSLGISVPRCSARTPSRITEGIGATLLESIKSQSLTLQECTKSLLRTPQDIRSTYLSHLVKLLKEVQHRTGGLMLTLEDQAYHLYLLEMNSLYKIRDPQDKDLNVEVSRRWRIETSTRLRLKLTEIIWGLKPLSTVFYRGR